MPTQNFRHLLERVQPAGYFSRCLSAIGMANTLVIAPQSAPNNSIAKGYCFPILAPLGQKIAYLPFMLAFDRINHHLPPKTTIPKKLSGTEKIYEHKPKKETEKNLYAEHQLLRGAAASPPPLTPRGCPAGPPSPPCPAPCPTPAPTATAAPMLPPPLGDRGGVTNPSALHLPYLLQYQCI